MKNRQFDLFIAYYGNEESGSQRQAKELYYKIEGADLGDGRRLRVYFHPVTDPDGAFGNTPIIIQKTPLFLFVVESNPPVDPYGFIVSRDKNGQTRRIYEEIQAEQESRFYRINPAHAAKLYVCDGYSMEAAAQLHPIFNGKNHFSEEDGTLPVLQWAKEQLKELEEKGIFPVRAKNGEPQSPTQGGVSEEMFEQMRQKVVSLEEELQSRPTQGGVSEEQFEKMREENVRLQEELKKREAEEAARATPASSFEFEAVPGGYAVKKYIGKETEVVIPSIYNGKPVVVIGELAFKDSRLFGNTRLKAVIIPGSVTTIGEGAFSWCSGLESIEIPEGVTAIGARAFFHCENLVRIKIPNSVTTIGERVFSWCRSLESITVEADNPKYQSIDGNLYTKDGKVLLQYAAVKKDESFTIPSSVTAIGGRAFDGCSSLASITIPESVTTIGASAFSGCSNLKIITIPSSVTTIGASAFSGCESLTSILIMNGVIEIGASAFEGCKSLTSITIPRSVTAIGERAFFCCSSLTNITIPESVTTIGVSVFNGCSSLTSIFIKNGVTTIGARAFSGCRSLASITIPRSVTTIGEWAFDRCGFESIEIPEGVTSIGVDAFSQCESLVRIKIPNSVTTIGERAFSWCRSLESITVEADNPEYQSIDGNLYTKGGKVLIQYAAVKKDESFTIPNSVTAIGSCAFSGCSSLASITIPNSVTTIEGRAFYGCSSLKNITIPSSVTTIGEWAFDGCGFESIEIPEGVTTIGKCAFHGCSSLEKMSFQDPNGWYCTKELSDWENRRNGVAVDLKEPKRNAEHFRTTYQYYYWYKK